MGSMFNERQQENFPSTSEVNPRRDGKEHCKSIRPRRGKTIEKLVQNNAENDEDNAESGENNARTIGKAEKLLKILVRSKEKLS